MKILSSASARPNFVKLAAVHHALAKKKGVEHVIVHTGQHYDPLLSDVFFKQLEIPSPNHNLGIKGGGSTREEVIEATMFAMMEILEKEKPDIVLVYGDVNGAVGAAKAAKKLGIRLGHVEAGLRSKDKSMPEENNRIEIDKLADKLFTTEKSAEDNIKGEGLRGDIHFVGNTMIDTLLQREQLIDREPLEIELRKINPIFAVVTLHRLSNVDQKNALDACMNFLQLIANEIPIYLPVHPRLKTSMKKFGWMKNPNFVKNMIVLPPKSYFAFLHLMKSSQFIITDSGGIQEEAVLLGKRCFTLRRNTERPSTIESGSNVLIDPSKREDRETVLDFAKNPKEIEVKIPPLWDGKAGERIADILAAA